MYEKLLIKINDSIPGGLECRSDDNYIGLIELYKYILRKIKEGRFSIKNDISVIQKIHTIAQNIFINQSKDLSLLTLIFFSSVIMHGLSGFKDVIYLIYGNLNSFWNYLFPNINSEFFIEQRLIFLKEIDDLVFIINEYIYIGEKKERFLNLITILREKDNTETLALLLHHKEGCLEIIKTIQEVSLVFKEIEDIFLKKTGEEHILFNKTKENFIQISNILNKNIRPESQIDIHVDDNQLNNINVDTKIIKKDVISNKNIIEELKKLIFVLKNYPEYNILYKSLCYCIENIGCDRNQLILNLLNDRELQEFINHIIKLDNEEE